MKHYELMAVLPGTLAEDELPAVLTSITDILTEQGATEVRTDDMGKNRLAYPMKHIRYGYFYMISFQAEPRNIPEMQAKLRLTTNVLRALFTAAHPSKQKEQADRLAAMAAYAARNKKDMPRREERAAEDVSEEEPTVEAPEPPQKKAAPTEAPAEVAPKEEEKKPISMDDIDEKLDEILDSTIANI